MPVSFWRLPLYGNLFLASDLEYENLFAEREETIPTYFVAMGQVYVALPAKKHAEKVTLL